MCIFAIVYLLGSRSGGRSFASALGFAGLYTLLFIPLGYMLDRFTHNRFQRRAEQQGGSKRGPAAKKR